MQPAASSHLLLRAGLVAFLCSISVPSADCFATHATPFAGQGLRTLSCPVAFPVTQRVSAARPQATSVSMGLELEASAETTVRAPMERVWGAWSDFEQMPNWMPWIHAVEVQGDGVSKWTMRYETLGVPLRYSWTAKELPPVKHNLIHWETTSGLDNKGRVEFSTLTGDDGSEQVGVKMTIVYKLPRLVAMITRDKGENGAVKKTVQRIIQADLKRFKRAMERDGAAGEDA